MTWRVASIQDRWCMAAATDHRCTGGWRNECSKKKKKKRKRKRNICEKKKKKTGCRRNEWTPRASGRGFRWPLIWFFRSGKGTASFIHLAANKTRRKNKKKSTSSTTNAQQINGDSVRYSPVGLRNFGFGWSFFYSFQWIIPLEFCCVPLFAFIGRCWFSIAIERQRLRRVERPSAFFLFFYTMFCFNHFFYRPLMTW